MANCKSVVKDLKDSDVSHLLGLFLNFFKRWPGPTFLL